jgi:hypothetical protein
VVSAVVWATRAALDQLARLLIQHCNLLVARM